MEIIKLENVQFTYPNQATPSLSSINTSIKEGEFVVICGPSGCGKTTLLRHLKPELFPFGEYEGVVKLEVEEQEIGMVMQNPDHQIVMDNVIQELAFSLENRSMPYDQMRRRVAEIVQCLNMSEWIYKTTDELSGGQKQLLNLASILVQRPRLLLLDEPTAQLDPVAARELIRIVHQLQQELGITVVICEHRLEEVIAIADQVWMMDQGEIVYQGTPHQVIKELQLNEDKRFQPFLPAITRFFISVQAKKEQISLLEDIPLSVRAGRQWLKREKKWLSERPNNSESHVNEDTSSSHTAKEMIRCDQLYFQYQRDTDYVLRGLSLQVDEQEIVALMGSNGSGKTTLLLHLASLLRPQSGKIWINQTQLTKWRTEQLYQFVGYVPQNPLVFFAHDTVEKELRFAAERVVANQDVSIDVLVDQTLDTYRLRDKRAQHPYDLSGGERQLLMLACVLMTKPKLLLLDEPTKGLDPIAKGEVITQLQQLHRSEGLTIIMVTHDVEFAASIASRCLLLFDGEVAASEPTRTFFIDNFYYTTPIHRLLREHLPGAILLEEAYDAWKRRFELG